MTKHSLMKCILALVIFTMIPVFSGCDDKEPSETEVHLPVSTELELERAGTWDYSFFEGMDAFTEHYDPDAGFPEAIAIETFSSGTTPYMVMSFESLSSNDNSRLIIFSMTDPVSPRMVSTIVHDNSDENECLVRDMEIKDSIIYCGLFGDRGLWAVDVSDPAHPADLGISPIEAHDNIEISGDYLYSSGMLYNGIIVCDISDPSNITEIRKIDIATRDCILKCNDSVLLLGIRNILTVYDISSPDNPVQSAELELSLNEAQSTDVIWEGHIMNWSNWAHINDIAISGDYAYIAFGSGDIRVVDISDPAHPKEIDEIELPGFTATVNAQDGLLYVSTEQYETDNMMLSVLDISKPDTPQFIDMMYSGVDFVYGGISFAYCWISPIPVDELIMVPGRSLIRFFKLSVTPNTVLTKLPVYPGATSTTAEATGFEPFSTPIAPESEGRPPDIEYATATTQYTAKESAAKIVEWYEDKLTAHGYTKYTSMDYNGPDGTNVYTIGFIYPDHPLISVEIHGYDATGDTVFAVIVSKDMTTELNPAPPVPDDIVRIRIKRFDEKEKVIAEETITEAADIAKISEMINSLPALPDAPVIPDKLLIEMNLFSEMEYQKINLSYDTVRTGGYMVRMWNKVSLSDDDGMLLEAVDQLLGIEE